MKPYSIQEFAIGAERNVGVGLFDYINRTAGDGRTHRSNVNSFHFCDPAFDRREFADAPDTSTRILGKTISVPIMIAPTAFHGMFTPQGEAATSSAAKAFGTNYAISSFSTLDFPQIDSDLSHTWYQLLMYRNLDLMKRYIDRAVDAGCSAIVLTIDAFTGCSMCKRDSTVPPVEFPVHKLPVFPEDPAVQYTTLDDYYLKYMPGVLNWDDIRKLVVHTPVPIILKGVLSASDVIKAIKVGAKAVIVSNHGGRQNDTLPSTFDSLKTLPPSLGEEIEIYLDGGIRDGGDVFKALAYGAKAVLIGRPALYGLASGGKDGLLGVLNMFTDQLRDCMGHATCLSLADITRDKIEEI